MPDQVIDVEIHRPDAILRSVVLHATTPPAGKDWTYTFTRPTRLRMFRARLVTSATVATRIPYFKIQDANGDELWSMPHYTNQVASETVDFSVYQGASFYGVNSNVSIPLPIDTLLLENWTLSVGTTALAATDQWSDVQMVGDVYRWQDV